MDETSFVKKGKVNQFYRKWITQLKFKYKIVSMFN